MHILNDEKDYMLSTSNIMKNRFMICKQKIQQQIKDVKIIDKEQDDQPFMVTRFTSVKISENWLIDSDSTNHMTHNKDLFKELNRSTMSMVRKITNE